MAGPKPEVEVARVAARGARGPRPSRVLVLVPGLLVAIVAFAVIGRPPAVPRVGPPPSGSASAPGRVRTSNAPSIVPTPRVVADLSIDVPDGPIPLDFTRRALPGTDAGLTGTVRAELVPGHTYTLLVRCHGRARVAWPTPEDTPGAPLAGALPCDGDVHEVRLPLDASVAAPFGIDFSFDLAADTRIVVVESPGSTPSPGVVAVPLAPDGSRPAALGAATDALAVDEMRQHGSVTALVVRSLSLAGFRSVLSVIPASAFPRNARPALFNGSSAISRNGYLAVPFETDDEKEEVAVFDLTDPLAPAAVVGDRATGFGWGPDGQLAVGRAGGIGVYDPVTRRVDAVPIATDLDLGGRFTWTTDARFAATRTTGGSIEVGEIRGDGAFLPGAWPLFDPLGIERTRAADGRTLGEACETGANGGGCFPTVSGPGTRQAEPWTGGLDTYTAADALWTSDGRSVWLFATAGEGRARLIRSPGPTIGHVVARFPLRNQPYESPQVVGASADDAAIAIGIDTRLVIVVDTRTGATRRVGGSFAGWADTRGSVYPSQASR
jgi:hypothetical protein